MKRQFLLFVILSVSIPFYCQTSNIVLDFYKWYLDAIKKQPLKEYAPIIEPTVNGMTTLNFKQYTLNLRKYHCSNKMINNELSSYKACLKELANIKFDCFQHDIDYDEINCDYVNTYRWIHSQEFIDGVKIIQTQILNSHKQLVVGQFYNINDETQEYLFWKKYCYILLIENNEKWEIDNIDIINY
jgi:hypothetical protein